MILVTITNPEHGYELDLTIKMSANGRPMPSYKLPIMKALYLNANLASLVVSQDGSFLLPPETLYPEFDPSERNYVVNVPEDTNYVFIRAELPEDVYSTAKLFSGNAEKANTNLTTSFDSGSIDLEYGSNVFEIVVTADSGETKTYTLTVDRELSSANIIEKFEITDFLENEVSVDIDHDENTIDVIVPIETDLSNLDVKVTHTGFSVQHNGTNGTAKTNNPAEFFDVDFSTSSRTFTVIAANEDPRSYTVTVTPMDPVATVSIVGSEQDKVFGSLEDAFAYVNLLSGSITATITVLQDIEEQEPITITAVTSSKTINLVSEGENTITLTDDGSLFAIPSNVTLNIGGTSSNKLTLKGKEGNGSALVTVSGGTFTLGANAIITENKRSSNAGNNGGGVYLNGGTFNMTGGTISGNSATNGGGVYVNGGIFDFQNGTISENSVANGGSGGGVYFAGTTFNMSGTVAGTVISDNSATNGGGIYVASGTFTMNGGAVSAPANGTAIYNSSTSNTAIRINGGNVTATGTSGIAVHSINSTVIVSQTAGPVTSISSGNTNTSRGTIFIDAANTNERVRIEGGTVSNTNASGNFVYAGNGQLTINRTLLIPVNRIHPNTVKLGTNNNFERYFTLFQTAFSSTPANQTSTITVLQSTEITDSGEFVLDSNKDIHIVVENGRTLGIILAPGNFPVFNIQIGSTLTLGSDSPLATGILTLSGDDKDAQPNRRGVFNDGTLNMYKNVTISNFYTSGDGGGVYVGLNCTFNMYGGTISHNKALDGNGGGVRVFGGTFTMRNNSTIEHNTAFFRGGGVHASSSGSNVGGIVTMWDTAKISNNIGGNTGGGICVDGQGSRFTMRDQTIISNNSVIGIPARPPDIPAARGNGGGVAVVVSSRFELYGGKIYGNDLGDESFANTAEFNGASFYSSNGVWTYIWNGTSLVNLTPSNRVFDKTLEGFEFDGNPFQDD
ncbi:MAG: cadherin-like beta sandwich domain-containing protein [Treponema sp.]|nr:cadherin-like beta sandwich domain-containing protein [Treponema sp.]